MSNVIPLPVRAHARASDPVTSHQAARSVGDLRSSQLAVLRLFADAANAGIHGMTDEQLVRWYGRQQRQPLQSASGLRTRRRELVDAGYLTDTGERARMASGRSAVVWGMV